MTAKAAKKAYQSQPALDTAERERLLLEHLPQVQFIARRIHDRLPRHVDLEDLINTGVLGLVEALHKFDPAKDCQLGTYAKHRIRGAILDSLRKLDWAPRNLRKKAREIEEALRVLQGRLGRAPGEHEIAAELGMELEKFQQLLGELKGLELGHLEDMGPENEDKGLSRYAASPDEDPFFQCARSEMREFLTSALGELPPREHQVMALYYFEEMTLKEVGAILGVNESRVSQIHSAAMMRLRARMRQMLAASQQAQARPPENGGAESVARKHGKQHAAVGGCPVSQAPANSGAAAPACQPYDFRRASQGGGRQFRAFSSLHEELGRRLHHALAGTLRRPVSATLSNIQPLSYGEYLDTTSPATYLATMTLRSLGRVAALELEPRLVLLLLDLLLSGDGNLDAEPRAITEVEEQIIEPLARTLCQQLEAIWKPLLHSDAAFDRKLSPAQFQALMPARERLTLLQFELTLGEVGGAMKVLLPSAISHALVRASSQRWLHYQPAAGPVAASRLRERLQKCTFDAQLLVPNLRVPLRDLMELQPSQILAFRRPVSEPAIVVVGGRPLFSAHPAASGPHRAAQIERRFTPRRNPERSSTNV